MNSLPTQTQLDQAWDEVCELHREYLQVHGVKLPKKGRKKQYRWIWLAVLRYYDPGYVHKDKISEVVRQMHPEAATDQQVRHLKRDGWDLQDKIPHKKEGLHKVDWYNPSPELVNEQARRQGRLDAESFAELKQTFGNRCATCGATESRPDPRYGDDVVRLQQGHQDPEGSADDKANLIPQCQFCNRAYKDDFVFDDKGRVRTIASIEPVKRASKKVRREVKEWASSQPN